MADRRNNQKGIRIFTNDFNRGVKHFKDKNYSQYGSAGSLRFFNYAKHFITDVKRVVLLYDNKHWYRMKIITGNGYEFFFYGCSFGYYGEGSRTSAEILKQLGFKESQIKKVFDLKDHMSGSDKLTLIK